jgi:putative membrane protein
MIFNPMSNLRLLAVTVTLVGMSVGCGKTTLTDGEIFGILKTANDGQISFGQRAQAHAQGASVQSFASSVVSTDTDANTRQEALATNEGITPVTSSTNTNLQSANDAVTTKLVATPDSAFDSEYISQVISSLQNVLDIVNNDMIPDAHNADLKTELATTQATVTSQLSQAKAIQAQ